MGEKIDYNNTVKYITEEGFRASRGNIKYLDKLRDLARKNRKNPTEAENLFWKAIKKYNYPFLRQKPINNFIVDFYCSKLLLAIEIDGGYHLDRKNYDSGREERLKMMGIKIIRFSNHRIVNDLKKVLEDLNEIMIEREKELF